MSLVRANPLEPSAAIRNQLSDMILSAPPEILASSLALLQEMSLFSLVASETFALFEKAGNKITRGSWTSDSDKFQEALASATVKNTRLSPGELLLRIYGEIKALSPVASHDFRSGFDFSEMAEDLCLAAVNQMRSNKESGFTGQDIQSMIEFQMSKMFGGLQVSIVELSSSQQDTLIAKIKEYVTGLPADQQKFIMDKLGASQVTESVIRTAVANGTMWVAFAAAVQVFGFAFYTTAAQILAFVSLNMLPFGAYIGLSSLIAVFANPLTLVAMAGLGFYLAGRKNSQLKQSMLPIVITSLCLAGMEKQADDPSYREVLLNDALKLWADARSKLDMCRAKEAECKETLNLRQKELRELERKLKGERARLSSAESNVSGLTSALERAVDCSVGTIASGNWGPALVNAAQRVQTATLKSDRSWDGISQARGFWNTVGALCTAPFNALENSLSLDKAKKALVSAVETGALPTGPATVSARTIIAERAESLKVAQEARREIAQLEFQVRAKQGNVSNAQAAFNTAQSARVQSETPYAGLRDC